MQISTSTRSLYFFATLHILLHFIWRVIVFSSGSPHNLQHQNRAQEWKTQPITETHHENAISCRMSVGVRVMQSFNDPRMNEPTANVEPTKSVLHRSTYSLSFSAFIPVPLTLQIVSTTFPFRPRRANYYDAAADDDDDGDGDDDATCTRMTTSTTSSFVVAWVGDTIVVCVCRCTSTLHSLALGMSVDGLVSWITVYLMA